ncbi:MAG: GNAT family N-acetyltransferase [Anaerolineae bacterium]|nr:GNAT family N-acetyltransferase [Anaerolineae bacterium]
MTFEPQPTELIGEHIHLKPLQSSHYIELWPHANERDIWRYMPFGDINSLEKMKWLVSEMLRRQALGNDVLFAQIDPITRTAIGMTRYMTIERANKSLEIGGSWLSKAYRRTPINTEAKYLLMRHAFETLGAIRLQFRTDTRNERSQRAIERIGAVREGVLRKNILMPDGYQRSSVIYSVLDEEWPGVKQKLEALLEK